MANAWWPSLPPSLPPLPSPPLPQGPHLHDARVAAAPQHRHLRLHARQGRAQRGPARGLRSQQHLDGHRQSGVEAG